MIKLDDIQKAISRAAESGMGAVTGKAFEKVGDTWRPRSGCLGPGYSSGEQVVCGILLIFYFEVYGSSSFDHVERPETDDWENSLFDAVWKGAYFFLKACDNLTDRAGWDAILTLLPKSSTSL